MSALSVRRPLSVLAVLAMVATLLFAVAGTASAATVLPQNEATFSACPDNAAIPDAGFTDIPTASFFDDSVNCLAYYAVTKGTTPTEYGPADDVTRAQMAVFLYRMAGVAGVVLSATPPDAGFTDISELSAEAQTAINALAAKGIVKGKTATTYSPADSVWRQQMALFLARFSDAASAPTAGPGGTQAKAVTATTNNFTDLGSTTVEANKAINQVFHLGVAAGNTATTFNPLGNVNRGQMSLFLTRLAAHMNVRPAGVNIQASPTTGNDIVPAAGDLTSDISVTVRNADFTPAANTVVDQWRFATTTNLATTPFLGDGTCNATLFGVQTFQMVLPGTPCTLDAIDSAVGGFGNWTPYTLVTPAGYTHMLYAWTGATGAKFDVDTTTYSMTTIKPTASADGYTFKLDGSTTTPQGNKFGEAATWIIQVTDNDKAIAEAGWTFTLTTQNTDYLGNVQITTGIKLKTDANGQVVITQTKADPVPATTGQTEQFWGAITLAPVGLTLDAGGTNGPLAMNWSDAASVATTVTVSSATEYAVSANNATNAVTALVKDQNGNPMPNVRVDFTSTDNAVAPAEGIGAVPVTRTTDSQGKATLTYAWKWSGTDKEDNSALEEIDVVVDPLGANFTSLNNPFYWVVVAPNVATTGAYLPVLVVDEASKALVILVNGGAGLAYHWFQWDANDQFNIDYNPPVTPVTMSDFEKWIDDFNATPSVPRAIGIAPYSASAAGISMFQVR
jgi:hypothetical protein